MGRTAGYDVSSPAATAALFNRPLALERRALSSLARALGNGATSIAVKGLLGFGFSSQRYNVDASGVATLPIRGVLTHRGSGLSRLLGSTDYENLGDDFDEAMSDPLVRTIAFDVDSPGGEVEGLFDLVDKIAAARSRKPIIAIVNESGFSAAYAIASAAGSVYVPRTGGVGSIGILAEHYDYSSFEQNVGVKVTSVYAGDRKNDGSPHEPLSARARAEIQKQVDAMNAVFVSTVARNRAMTSDREVSDLEAALFFGPDAVRAGLADAVKSVKEARAAAASAKPSSAAAGRAAARRVTAEVDELIAAAVRGANSRR